MNEYAKRKWHRVTWTFIIIGTIGVLLAVAIPSFVKRRKYISQSSCINNLKMIEAAKYAYAMEHNCPKGWSWSNDVIAFKELYGEKNGERKKREGPYYIKKYLHCPVSTNTTHSAEQAASEYAVNPFLTYAKCKVRHDHSFSNYNGR